MRSSKHSERVGGALGAIILGAAALAIADTKPSIPASPDARIDGTSEASFEASIASLQNALPSRRRENLQVALAVIWLSKTLGPNGLDLDGDGNVDAIDTRLLAEDAKRLLIDIQRGDLLVSIETREKKYGTYTVADYIKRLNGLGYEEVLDLAGRPGGSSERSIVRPMKPPPPTIDAATGRAFNEAVEAIKQQNFAGARSRLGGLKVSRLSPYEHSKVEQILFEISYSEGKFAEAREHLQNAINAEGLNPQEVSAALVEIRLLDAKLAADPTNLLPFPKLP